MAEGNLTPAQRDMIAKLICEVEHLRETGDIRDSMQNEPQLTAEARVLFQIPHDDGEIEVGKRYRFAYPQEYTLLPQYSAHRGQSVTVLREHVAGAYYDYEGDRMFRIRADDGWEADAWESELEPVTEDAS